MERIPSNIILKSLYGLTTPHFLPKYQIELGNEITNYISSTDPHLYDTIEIEAKLGHFDFKGSGIMSFSKIQETFLIPEFQNIKEFKYEFNAGLSADYFYLIWNAMNNEASLPYSEINALPAETYNDIIYKSGKRKSIVYRNGEVVREEVIRKENKKHFNVRNFSNDFRITCCREMPSDITDDDSEVTKRKKFRTSYEFKFYRVDFTITSSSQDGYSMICYEIELEIHNLKQFLNNGANFDVLQLRTLLERFVQNILCLYTATTMESMLHMEKSKEKKKEKDNDKDNNDNKAKGIGFKSLFGNYLENNIGKDH